MSGYLKAAAYLPEELKSAVLRVPEAFAEGVQEIRLRENAPLTLSLPDREWMISPEGMPVKIPANAVMCKKTHLDECFLKLCDYSVHTHQNELAAGFITAGNGCRAGIAGAAVIEDGKVVSVRDITSVCLRVARRHTGCASELISALVKGGKLYSALICGEPSSGKSSLLKDLARQLSAGAGGRRWRTAVVDERCELSGDGSLACCDVLRGFPKGIGISQAVRCLAPDVVIFDELGNYDEVKAVTHGLNSGVAVIATAHCHDVNSLLARPPLLAALQSRAFERVVFLKGRSNPGRLSFIMESGDLIDKNNRGGPCVYSGSGGGTYGVGLVEQACRIV